MASIHAYGANSLVAEAADRRMRLAPVTASERSMRCVFRSMPENEKVFIREVFIRGK